MHPETMIPVLPSVSLADTLAFYRLLGFEVTYQQARPYVYAATRRGGMEVHFMGIPELDPKGAYSTCLVMVPEVEQLHATFAGALRGGYGKLPIAGIPRITRMKPGQTRFTIVDVAGNSLVFIKKDAGGSEDEEPLEAVKRRPGESRLAHGVRFAARLRDFKNDDEMAARVLDLALARPDPGDPFERARALAARIELAIALGQPDRADALGAELAALPLSPEQRDELAAELERAHALERSQA
ncbi:hypothetical protein [Nannocystis bainbridge]|uniref:VOC family protein n=1 Tax=Nannocystis bainbridge TaxID=2995303 RepID=A0ABT5E4M0_9BACT|nr:hypothetical protein [Nannocystis bainbridge]MDC0720814.1 hypothetical protein [Nannocystis bainbridge]